MCKGRFRRRASLSTGASLGIVEGAPIPGTLKYEWKRAPGVGNLSLKEPNEGNLEGRLLYCGAWRMCKGRLRRRASLSTGASLGNVEGAPIPGTLKYEWKTAPGVGNISLKEPNEGNLEGGLLYWGPQSIW